MDDIGKGLYGLVIALLIIAVVSVPLAIWKFIELVSWVFNNVTINW